MRFLPKTARGISYFYLLLLLLIMSMEVSELWSVKGKQSLNNDTALFYSFLGLLVLFFLFLLIESKFPVISSDLPYMTMVFVYLLMLLIIFVPYIFHNGLNYYYLYRRVFSYINNVLFLLISIAIPIYVYRKNMELRVRVSSFLIAVLYFIHSFLPKLIWRISHSYTIQIDQRGKWFNIIFITIFILVIVIHGEHDGRKDKGSFFILLGASIASFFFGVFYPVTYKDNGWYKTATYVNGVFSHSGITHSVDLNVFPLFGIVVLFGFLVLHFLICLEERKNGNKI